MNKRISAPIFKANKPSEMQIDFYHVGIPLAQTCSLFTPFIINWVKNFFHRELEKVGNKYPVRNPDGSMGYVKLKDPSLYFNEEYLKKQIDRFIFSVSDRFTPIELPVEEPRSDGKKLYMRFIGKDYKPGVPETESPLVQRKATWCDILYQAAVDVTSDKMVFVTRYPISDYFSSFPNKISVLSTHQTIPMFIGNRVYTNYPRIDLSLPKEEISTLFADTVSMSNLYLPGLNGDKSCCLPLLEIA